MAKPDVKERFALAVAAANEAAGKDMVLFSADDGWDLLLITPGRDDNWRHTYTDVRIPWDRADDPELMAIAGSELVKWSWYADEGLEDDDDVFSDEIPPEEWYQYDDSLSERENSVAEGVFGAEYEKKHRRPTTFEDRYRKLLKRAESGFRRD